MVKAQPKEFATLTSPTQTLADYVSGLSYKKIPQAVISHTKLCIIDALGCALFGSTLPWGKIITSFTKEMGKGKGALIWGDGAEVPSTSAPLANGTLIHSFEMDDLHRVGVIHPGAEAIPPRMLSSVRSVKWTASSFLPPSSRATKSVAALA